jgi:hypothetical protein
VTRLQKQRFKHMVNSLNALLEEVREEHPRANYYLEGDGSLHLLSDDSHDESGKAHPERSLVSTYLRRAGGGGW